LIDLRGEKEGAKAGCGGRKKQEKYAVNVMDDRSTGNSGERGKRVEHGTDWTEPALRLFDCLLIWL
jgi:hypothetical protein